MIKKKTASILTAISMIATMIVGTIPASAEGLTEISTETVHSAILSDKDTPGDEVCASNDVEATQGEGVVDVKIATTELKKHTNGAGNEGYWTGFAVVAPEGVTQMKYAFGNDTEAAMSDLTAIEENVYISEGVMYSGVAFYVNAGDANGKKYAKLQWFDGDGNAVSAETVYAIDTSAVTFAIDYTPSVSAAILKDTVEADKVLYGSYSVSCDENNVINIAATDLKKHTNGAGNEGYWIGFAVVAPTGATQMKYAFGSGSNAELSGLSAIENNVCDDKSGVAFYLDAGAANPKRHVKLQWFDENGIALSNVVEFTINIDDVEADFNSVFRAGTKYFDSFSEAFEYANTNGTDVDLLGNTVVLKDEYENLTKTIVVENTVTFRNGTIDISGFEAEGESIFCLRNNEVGFENINIKGENYNSAYGVIYANVNTSDVTLTNCTFNLKNDASEVGGVIKGSSENNKFTIRNCKFELKDPVRVFANINVDMTNTEINAETTGENRVDNAFRNVGGTMQSCAIKANGFENGIKNTSDISLEIKDGSNIEIANSVGKDGEPGYDLLVKGNSVIKSDYSSTLSATTKDITGQTSDGGIFVGCEDGTYKRYCLLSFELSHGTLIGGQRIYLEGDEVKLADYVPTRGGATFKGWYADSGYTTALSTFNITSDTTVYAKWKATRLVTHVSTSSKKNSEYTVSFNSNGGTAVSSVKVESGKKLSEPKVVTKDGFEFAGWYTDKALTEKYDFSNKVTKSFTLYAKWTEKDNNNKEIAFNDVSESDWYFDVVKMAVESGLMNGISDNEFAPELNITRGMFVTVLYRADNQPTVSGTLKFSDVSADAYYKNAVIWATENGIADGISETEFAPEKNITREQMAVMIARYAEYKGIKAEKTQSPEYADGAEISDYAEDGIATVSALGIIEGNDDGTFAPRRNASRAEAAAVFARLLNVIK